MILTGSLQVQYEKFASCDSFKIMRFIAFAIIFSVCASKATAHDWYAPTCCKGNDCRPAKSGEVVGLPGGYRVISRGVDTVLKERDSRIQPSRDDSFHICIIEKGISPDKGYFTDPFLQCLYVPEFGV